MTELERALLKTVAKFVMSGIDTPYRVRRDIQELMNEMAAVDAAMIKSEKAATEGI